MPTDQNAQNRLVNSITTLLIGCLVFYFAISMVRPLLMMSGPTLTAYNEGWNAGFAQRLIDGLPLYPSTSELVTNNYPPLSFLFYALIGKTGLDLIYTGRLFALLAFGTSAFLLFSIARSIGCAVKPAALGALLLLVTIARFFPTYVGMNEPQWLAHMVMLCGLLAFIKADTRKKLIISAFIMLIAGFIKHNILAVPLACTVWLFIHNRKDFLFFICAGALMAAASVITMHIFFGPAIWQNLFNARIISAAKLLRKSEHVLAVIVPLTAWIGANITNSLFAKNKYHQLVSLYIAFAFAEILAFGAGDGVAANVAFDLVIACSLGAACLLNHLKLNEKPNITAVFLLFLLFLQIAAWPNYRYIAPAFSAKARQYFADQKSAVGLTINTLKNVKGNAWCEQPNICYWAGKPFTFDSYNVKQRLALGRIFSNDIQIRFNELNISAIQFDMRDVKVNTPSSTQEDILAPLLSHLGKNITDANGFGSVMVR